MCIRPTHAPDRPPGRAAAGGAEVTLRHMENRHHDLVVIGTGSGNSVITPRLDHLDIGLVEKGRFGGTCLNVGCIPTKMFVLPADRVVEAREAARLGVHVDGVRADWPAIRDRIFGRIDPISADGEAYREKADNVTVYREQARFTGPMTLDTGTGVTVTADRWVIAAGSRPRLLDIEGLDRVDPDRGVHTSDTVMRMESLPEGSSSWAVGSSRRSSRTSSTASAATSPGSTAANACSSNRTSRSPAPTPRSPGPARRPAAHHRHRGPARRPRLDPDDDVEGRAGAGSRPTRCSSRSGGRQHRPSRRRRRRVCPATRTAAWLSTPSSRRRSAGCSPSATSAASGSSSTWPTTRCGWSSTTCCSRTAPIESDHRFVPHAVFTHPQLAAFGKTEQELREARHALPSPYEQRVATSPTGGPWRTRPGSARSSSTPTPGAARRPPHGPHASTVIQPLVQAAHFGQRADDVAKGQYWIHPALAEVVENALLDDSSRGAASNSSRTAGMRRTRSSA